MAESGSERAATGGSPLGDAAASVNAIDYPTVGAALAMASPGSAVTIRPGIHGAAEDFPLTVPKGVRLLGEPGAVLDASAGPPRVAAVLLAGNGSALHHVTVVAPPSTSPTREAVAVGATTAVKIAVRACTVRGSIVVTGGSGVSLTGNDIDEGRIVVKRSNGTQVIRNHQTAERAGAGIAIEGGSEHAILGNVVTGGSVGIAVTGATSCDVSGNGVRGQDVAIEVIDCGDTVVGHNAIDGCVTGIRVIGGSTARITENDVVECDTGIELGPSSTSVVQSNRMVRARIGITVNRTADVSLVDNELADCREHGIQRQGD